MRWPRPAVPVRVERVALVAPAESLRTALVEIADAGTVEVDGADSQGDGEGPAARRLRRARAQPRRALLCAAAPDLDRLERDGRIDLLSGEAQLERYVAGAVRRGDVAALAGWCPAKERPRLAERLAAAGASVVPLRAPHGVDPPTLLRDGGKVRGAFGVLVRTYGTVPYADVDPTVLAGVAYVAMFGMMFGDAGHGLLLLGLAAVLALGGRRRRPAFLGRVARWRRAWPFLAAGGAASAAFGALYGEFFGPTGVLPVLWLSPLDDPVRLLVTAVGVGAGLLGAAYALGTVNRWREGGLRVALYAASGIAGSALFAGLTAIALAVYLRAAVLAVAGGAVACAGLVLAAGGFFATSGGGGAGAAQAGVELFDMVVRLGSNVVSFARLAAFGLTHAALEQLVWRGTVALGGHGVLGLVVAVPVFLAGNTLAFGLEALIAGVQALRLEYYELFSRVFESQGHPFRPWHVPTVPVPTTVEAAR